MRQYPCPAIAEIATSHHADSMSRSVGHNALRKGRTSVPGGLYLVTFATVHRHRLFARFDRACAAARTFTPSAAAAQAERVAWVLMPDHFHGLLRLHGAPTLGAVVQRIKSISTRACRPIAPACPVWARAFHDHALRHDERAEAVCRYLIGNPVRAGLMASVDDDPFWNGRWP